MQRALFYWAGAAAMIFVACATSTAPGNGGGADEDAGNTPIYDAAALTAQHKIIGPAIVITESTTYLVEPGWRLEPTQQGAVWFLRD